MTTIPVRTIQTLCKLASDWAGISPPRTHAEDLVVGSTTYLSRPVCVWFTSGSHGVPDGSPARSSSGCSTCGPTSRAAKLRHWVSCPCHGVKWSPLDCTLDHGNMMLTADVTLPRLLRHQSSSQLHEVESIYLLMV